MKDSGDYISREAANEACREAVRRYPNSFYNGIEAARDEILKLPDADVRPVLLCRDCKHATTWYRDRLLCFLWNEEGNSVFEDGFCSYGERRANDV